MRRVSKKALVVAAAAGFACLALLALLITAVVTADWAVFLVGLMVMSLIVLLLLVIRGQQQQRHATSVLAARMKDMTRRMDEIAARPVNQSGSRDEQVAQTAARFDWIARRQAEIIRLLGQAGYEETGARRDGATTRSATDGS